MLVLTRKEGESILIDGGRIKITLVQIRGDQIRIGIDAPKDVTIHREEVQARIDAGEPRPNREKAPTMSTWDSADYFTFPDGSALVKTDVAPCRKCGKGMLVFATETGTKFQCGEWTCVKRKPGDRVVGRLDTTRWCVVPIQKGVLV